MLLTTQLLVAREDCAELYLPKHLDVIILGNAFDVVFVFVSDNQSKVPLKLNEESFISYLHTSPDHF